MLGLVGAHDQIDLLARIGVAALLFFVGLKLDPQHIRHIGPVALATTGLGQLACTIAFGSRSSSRSSSRSARARWRRWTSRSR